MPTRALITRYEQDFALFPSVWHKVALVLGSVVVLSYPFLASDRWLTVGNQALTMVVGAVSLMILTGFTGQISLGHAAFLGVGAYTAAILGQHHIPFWIVIPAAGLMSAAVGLMIGPFALRLKGLYLAIVTIGLLFLVRHVLLSFPDVTGGVAGISVPVHSWFGKSVEGGTLSSFNAPLDLGVFVLTFERKLYFLFLLITVLCVFAAANIRRSDTGRTFMAVRDHDLAAAALGVHPAKTKILSFGISSFLAGVAGAMFGFHLEFLTVDPFNLHMSVQYIAIIILGGMGTVFGAVAGGLFFSFVVPLAEIVGRQTPILNTMSSAQQSTLLFALLVVTFLLLEPLGLFGVWLRIKRYFAAWPFRY